MSNDEKTHRAVANDPELTRHRVIQQVNLAILKDNKYTTLIAIRFHTEAIPVSEKNAKLYVELRKIDDTITFMDLDDNKYEEPSDNPQGINIATDFP